MKPKDFLPHLHTPLKGKTLMKDGSSNSFHNQTISRPTKHTQIQYIGFFH